MTKASRLLYFPYVYKHNNKPYKEYDFLTDVTVSTAGCRRRVLRSCPAKTRGELPAPSPLARSSVVRELDGNLEDTEPAVSPKSTDGSDKTAKTPKGDRLKKEIAPDPVKSAKKPKKRDVSAGNQATHHDRKGGTTEHDPERTRGQSSSTNRETKKTKKKLDKDKHRNQYVTSRSRQTALTPVFHRSRELRDDQPYSTITVNPGRDSVSQSSGGRRGKLKLPTKITKTKSTKTSAANSKSERKRPKEEVRKPAQPAEREHQKVTEQEDKSPDRTTERVGNIKEPCSPYDAVNTTRGVSPLRESPCPMRIDRKPDANLDSSISPPEILSADVPQTCEALLAQICATRRKPAPVYVYREHPLGDGFACTCQLSWLPDSTFGSNKTTYSTRNNAQKVAARQAIHHLMELGQTTITQSLAADHLFSPRKPTSVKRSQDKSTRPVKAHCETSEELEMQEARDSLMPLIDEIFEEEQHAQRLRNTKPITAESRKPKPQVTLPSARKSSSQRNRLNKMPRKSDAIDEKRSARAQTCPPQLAQAAAIPRRPSADFSRINENGQAHPDRQSQIETMQPSQRSQQPTSGIREKPQPQGPATQTQRESRRPHESNHKVVQESRPSKHFDGQRNEKQPKPASSSKAYQQYQRTDDKRKYKGFYGGGNASTDTSSSGNQPVP